MKTIKDVIAAYPDGWPSEYDYCFTTAPNWVADPKCVGSFKFANKKGSYDRGQLTLHKNTAWIFLCTREEYEQTLKDSKMESKCDFLKGDDNNEAKQ